MTTTTHGEIRSLLEDVLPILKAQKDHLERRISHLEGLPDHPELDPRMRTGQERDPTPNTIPYKMKLAEVNAVAERVIAMVGTLTLGVPVMPGLLLECPRAADVDAHLSAPTIPWGFAKKTFNIFETEMGEIVWGQSGSWLKEAALATGTEERGRLLTFTLAGEEDARIVWTRK